MGKAKDPTEAIRKRAAAMPAVVGGTSCNQSSFKTGKGSFLFIGPGAKGKGFKAMFKLGRSIAQAKKLASKDADRFQVGSTGWVTARFTEDRPLPKSIWEPWLKESYELTCGPKKKTAKKKTAKKKTAKKKTAKKKTAKKKTAKKKTAKKKAPRQKTRKRG